MSEHNLQMSESNNTFKYVQFFFVFLKLFAIAPYTIKQQDFTYKFIRTKLDLIIFIIWIIFLIFVCSYVYSYSLEIFVYESLTVIDVPKIIIYVSNCFLIFMILIISFTNGKNVFNILVSLLEIQKAFNILHSSKLIRNFYILLSIKLLMSLSYLTLFSIVYSVKIKMCIYQFIASLLPLFLEFQMILFLLIINDILSRNMYRNMRNVDVNKLVNIHGELYWMCIDINRIYNILTVKIIMSFNALGFVVFKLAMRIRENSFQIYEGVSTIIWSISDLSGIVILIIFCVITQNKVNSFAYFRKCMLINLKNGIWLKSK